MHAFGSFSDAYAYALERNLAAAAGVATFFEYACRWQFPTPMHTLWNEILLLLLLLLVLLLLLLLPLLLPLLL